MIATSQYAETDEAGAASKHPELNIPKVERHPRRGWPQSNL
jgi:hypothetical protein